MARTIGVAGGKQVEGIKIATEFVGVDSLAADLDSVSLGLAREVNRAIRAAAQVVVAAVPQFTPHDDNHRTDRPDNLGHLSDSFRAAALSATTAAIVSTHPAAPVFEYGGTIAPRTHGVTGQGADIKIPKTEMAYKAAKEQAPAFERLVVDSVGRLLAQHGL